MWLALTLFNSDFAPNAIKEVHSGNDMNHSKKYTKAKCLVPVTLLRWGSSGGGPGPLYVLI